MPRGHYHNTWMLITGVKVMTAYFTNTFYSLSVLQKTLRNMIIFVGMSYMATLQYGKVFAFGRVLKYANY